MEKEGEWAKENGEQVEEDEWVEEKGREGIVWAAYYGLADGDQPH